MAARRNHASTETRVLSMDQITYNTHPWWWRWQARVANCWLLVRRGEGRGWTEEHHSGGYAHVCTRLDMSGK